MYPHVTQLNNGSEINVLNTFEVKLQCKTLENKLKEFNLKLMAQILPCNTNLSKWRLRDSAKCDLCSEDQTIRHLLFLCARAKTMWKIFEHVYRMNIDYRDIVCGINDKDVHYVITIIAFLLYKEWLLESLNNKSREQSFPIHFFISELRLRQAIYNKNKTYLFLEPLIDHLETFLSV
jgi:hypothetical protein